MIPARSLNGEHAGVEVRYRIAACRKRLRHYRATRSAAALVETSEQVSEIEARPGDPSRDTARSFEQEEGER